ncbi:MAG: hypothetical protein ACYC06_09060 [Ilumatobacteraceae bacterium]
MFMRSSDSSIPEIDLRSVRDALKLRWWIVPLVMLISVGFLFANESDLQTSPGYVQISRVYEARDESAVLTVAGIDPASIVPYPSFDNQLLVLQTPETRQKIAVSINADTSVSVTRSEQKFSLLDTIEGEGKKRFTFLSVGTPSYTFSCAAPSVDECTIALDAYVAELSRLRAQSVQQGFDRAQKLVSALTGDTQIESTSFVIQQQALAFAKTLVTGEMVLISTTSEHIGPTVGTVKGSTYLFGLGVGALLGLLVVLQLTVTDRKIRTRRKLVAVIGEENVLGALRLDQQDSSPQHIAAGLVHQAILHGATSTRLLSIDDGNLDLTTATLTEALHGHSLAITSMNSVDQLTTMELLPPPHSIVVLVADAHTSRADNLEKVWAIAEHAGNTIAGVILVQH